MERQPQHEASGCGVGSDSWAIVPRGGLPVGRMSVNGHSRSLGQGVGAVNGREEPVPVEHRHVSGQARVWMPAEQVIVVLADLTRLVMVADVVEVELRQRSMHEAEDQENDPRRVAAPSSLETSRTHETLGR